MARRAQARWGATAMSQKARAQARWGATGINPAPRWVAGCAIANRMARRGHPAPCASAMNRVASEPDVSHTARRPVVPVR
jgi:hypothetical protein